MATIPAHVSVTEGTGLKLAAVSYTEATLTVNDQKVILGEQYLPTFTVSALGISTTSTGAHLLQIMAGSALNLRLRHIAIWQSALATTAALTGLSILRLTSAGTGGSAITPTSFDPADTATATAMSLPSAPGGASSIIVRPSVYFSQTLPLGGPGTLPLLYERDWDALRAKPPTVAAGATHGIAVVIVSGVAAATVNITVTYSELGF
jgi:hypothetical protein